MECFIANGFISKYIPDFLLKCSYATTDRKFIVQIRGLGVL